jgi:preprotein translocase subunit SecA
MKQAVQNKLTFRENLYYLVKRYKGINITTDLTDYNIEADKIQKFKLSQYSNTELKLINRRLKQIVRQGEDLDNLLPEAYALVSEVCSRELGIKPFPAQIFAGIAMHQAKLVQMKTGEGKTLAAVFPVYLNALTGKGVHVMTANDYLAKRDALWMGKIYKFLELEVGYIQEKTSDEKRKKAYKADVTYLTAKQGGFDFLRDQLQYDREKLLQGDYYMAIVDEADFVMIDEARIPMVIAAESPGSDINPIQIDNLFFRLDPETDYSVDRIGRNSFLTIYGQTKVQEILGCGGIHEEASFQLFAAVNVALHAHTLLTRDIDYVIKQGKIELIDESTGRIADNRRWPYGIQTALEAKERLTIQAVGSIDGSITIRNYINLYPKIAAMTATAVSAADEFKHFYNLSTVIIPPNRAEQMEYLPDKIFVNIKIKVEAILEDIRNVHSTGRPVLVGTRTVKESEEIAEQLNKSGINCQVLNAKNDEQEAAIIARAGMLEAITISTNMAGRGTDIKLGGEENLHREQILALGGLYVIGTNRYESVRIDNQLRGRAGRQGDPGSSCFFISLEDDLFQRYGITEFIPEKYRHSNSEKIISDRKVSREIARAQEIIEDQYFSMRKTLEKYSELIEKQRKYIQLLRSEALVFRKFPAELLERCKIKLEKFTNTIGKEETNILLCKIFLFQLDYFWRNHLYLIDVLREGIHLQRYGGKNPLLIYINEISETFELGVAEVMNLVVLKIEEIEISNKRQNNYADDLKGPSSTWTYLINDNPFPTFNISMIADSNIGFSAAFALQAGLLIFFETIRKLLRKKGAL